MSTLLGDAVLELNTDSGPLDRGLDAAEARVALSVSVMQRMLDRHMATSNQNIASIGTAFDRGLTGPIASFGTATGRIVADSERSLGRLRQEAEATARALDAVANRATSTGSAGAARRAESAGGVPLAAPSREPSTASLATEILAQARGVGASAPVRAAEGLSGVRGTTVPGSKQDPLAVVIEAARFAGMGSLAAAVGEDSAGTSDTSTGTTSSPVSAMSEQQLVDAMSRGTKDQQTTILRDMISRPQVAPTRPADMPAAPQSASEAALIRESASAAAASALAGKNLGPGKFASHKLAPHYPQAGYQAHMAPDNVLRLYGMGGQAGTSNYGAAPGGAGGGGDRGGLAALFGMGGGDKGGGKSILPALLMGGGGALGMAGMGSALSFAGFDAMHLRTTGGSILGSAGTGLAGGGLLAAGAAGSMAVGAGSDAAVMKNTLTQTKELSTAYEAVTKAVATYGAGSRQAVTAQKELNVLMAEMGNNAATKAISSLAKQQQALGDFWKEATIRARVQAAGIFSEVLKVGNSYVPLVAGAATQNLTLIRKELAPLFGWLKGPEAMGIFKDLERIFYTNIPHAVHAFTQGFELVAKTVDVASKYTGGFTAMLDKFFTKWNEPQFFSKWQDEIGRLIGDFHTWETLIKVLGQDIFYLFSNDAETGKGIVLTITQMLEKLREWEKSVKGSGELHNIFVVHKEEVIALLKIIPQLAGVLTPIYMTIAPPMVKVVTGIAEAIAFLLKQVEKLGSIATSFVGFTLIAAKLGVLSPVLAALGFNMRGVAESLGLVGEKKKVITEMTGPELAAALSGQTLAAQGAATAETELATAQTAAGATAVTETDAQLGLGGALSKTQGGVILPAGVAGAAGGAEAGAAGGLSRFGPTLLKAGLYGAGGALAGNVAATAVGAHGTLNTALTAAGAGAGIGFAVSGGNPLGAIAGAAIGAAAPLIIHGLDGIFSKSAPDYGKKFADGFTREWGSLFTARTSQAIHSSLNKGINDVEAARKHYEKTPTIKHENIAELVREKIAEHGGIPGIKFPETKHEAFDKQFTVELREGLGLAENLKKVQEEIRHPSAGAFIRMDLAQLAGIAKLHPEMLGAGAKAMKDFTAGLEAEKKLPLGSVDRLIRDLEHKFPALITYFAEHGEGVDRALAPALRLKQSTAALQNTLGNMRAEFGITVKDTTATGKKLALEWGSAMGQMEQAVREHVPGAAKALENLRTAGQLSFTLLARGIKHELGSIEGAVGKLGKELPGLGAPGFQKYEQLVEKMSNKVYEGWQAGVISTHEGVSIIDKALESNLAVLGAPTQVAQHLIKGHGSESLKAPPFKAGGGLVQIGNAGERGHDSIPMNIGGQGIIVAPGEQAAIFNHHQQAIVNARLADMGGLPGLFNSVNTPHNMASGGFTGYSLPLPRGSMMPGSWSIDQGVDISAGAGTPEFAIGPGKIISEGISGFGPNAPVLHITAGPLAGQNIYYGHAGKDRVPVGASVRAGQQISEVGAGIVGLSTGPHIEIGFGPPFGHGSTMAGLLHQLLGGAGVTGGVAASAATIHAPTVTGKGVVADMVRAGLGKVAHAATSYVGRHTPGTGVGMAGVAGTPASVKGSYSKAALEHLWIGAGGHPASAHLAAAVALAESGGNPNSENHNANGTIDRGLWQINTVHGAQSTFDIAGNVRAAIAISGNGSNWHPWTTYNTGAYTKFMARGGLLNFARGGLLGFGLGGHLGTKAHAAAKPKKQVGRHPKKPGKAKNVGLGHLLEHLSSAVPGFGPATKLLATDEENFSGLGNEETSLGSMTSNPASILGGGMNMLAPYLLPGEEMMGDWLVPHGERQVAREVVARHEPEGQGGEYLSEQSSLLQYIGGLDLHRVLTPADIGVLATYAHGKGKAFSVGDPVFTAQIAVLEAQKEVAGLTVGHERAQLSAANDYIKVRRDRADRLRKLLAVTFKRYNRLKGQIENLKSANLAKRLAQARSQEAKTNRVADAREQATHLQGAISAERGLPEVERNAAFLKGLESELTHVQLYITQQSRPSGSAVTNAMAALQMDSLRRELHPLESQLHLLGGNSTQIGTSGELGSVNKQVDALQKAAATITTKIEEGTEVTIPGLTLSIAGIQGPLTEQNEGVPPTIPHKAAGEKTGEAEKTALLKAQNEELSKSFAVSQAQYKVLANLPPFGGHFAMGGIVPGPTGAARTVIAHGGEGIGKVGATNIEVHVLDGAVDPNKIKVIANGEAVRVARATGRNVFRSLPGAGGGLVAR